MKADRNVNPSPDFTAEESRQLSELAAQAGLTVEGFKRACVRAYLAQPVPSARVGRGWLALNLDSWTEKRFRKAAALAGLKLQLFCRFALMDAAETLERKFAGYEKLSPKRIKVLTQLRGLLDKPADYLLEKN